MHVTSTLIQDTEQNAVYRISASERKGSWELYFTVSPEGALGFDNRQPGARLCAKRRVSKAMAEEMARTAREKVPGALAGRTVKGLAFELRVHNRAYRLGVLRRQAVTAELGSPEPGAPDFDRNAAFFERPLRGLPRVFKSLLSHR